MEELELLPDASTPAPVLIAFFDREFRDDYLRLASNLRAAGISVEVYPDAKKLGVQLKYASQKGFTVAIIAGGNEWDESRCQVKTLASRESADVAYTHESPGALVDVLQKIIADAN